jgi:tRNA modification GTPase
VDAALARARQGALLREGLQVVLAGQTNVGKSSLLNALAGAELAIVTPIPGTTRDKVSQTIQIEGVPLHVIDTAGLRGDAEAADEVERIGIGRSWQAIGAADAVVFLHDLARRGERPTKPPTPPSPRACPRACRCCRSTTRPICRAAATRPPVAWPCRPTRAKAWRRCATRCWPRPAGRRPAKTFIARTRHVQALQRTPAHLQQAQAQAALRDAALDLLAEELRLAHRALCEITGEFSSEDLLGEIFGRFCIGK